MGVLKFQLCAIDCCQHPETTSNSSACSCPVIYRVIRMVGSKILASAACCAGCAAHMHVAAQAFKSYDEAGAGRRIQCLKYLVLATMLMESAVDPFAAQEAAPYKQDPEVLAMTNLVAAYQENNIKGFERILKTNKCAPPAAVTFAGPAP